MFREGRRRVQALRVIFALALLLVAGRLALLQLVHHDRWFYRGFLNRERVQPRPVKRGAIRDRNGLVMVEDRGAHDVDLVYRDFRRGNPFGLAFHLFLETMPDPRSLGADDFRITRERISVQRRIWNLEGEVWRRFQDRREREALALEADIKRLAATLQEGLVYPGDEVPDPRRATLEWAQGARGRQVILDRIMDLGSRHLSDNRLLPLPERLRAMGVSLEDWANRARIVRGNIRFYLVRLFALVWRLRGEQDPSFRRQWESRGRTPEQVLGRRWRRELDRREEGVDSFARWFGVSRRELARVIDRGREALRRPGESLERKDPLAALDRIHKRNVRALLLYEGRNQWRLWDRNFRDRMAMVENRRDPLWKYVGYETVRKIALRPRAHQGFFVVNSVRRVYTTYEDDGPGGCWVPAIRLFGSVTGFTLDDARNMGGRNCGQWVDLVDICDLDPVSMTSYRDLLRKRARRLGESVWRIGRSGLEMVFNRELVGIEGYRVAEVARDGGLRQQHFQAPRRPGSDVVTSIDFNLQVALERALRDSRGPSSYGGAAIVDSRTGQILALATLPLLDREEYQDSFDRCLALEKELRRVRGGRRERYRAVQEMVREARFRLVDWTRRMPGRGMPGSTFKMVTALAGMRAGLAQKHRCPGAWSPGWTTYECHCGGQDLEEAIKESCNAYFGSLARALPEGALRQEARRLGFALSRKERIAGPLPGDTAFIEPDARDASIGIGYGVNVTPLAMARLYAAVATGTVPELSILAGTLAPGTPLGIPAAGLARIHDGMRRVVGRGGTADLGDNSILADLGVAGKTGTALHQKDPKGRRNAWFAGFLDYGSRNIAFAILAPNVTVGSQGGNTAAPILARFLADRRVQAWLTAKEDR